jgi:hypothetical protein
MISVVQSGRRFVKRSRTEMQKANARNAGHLTGGESVLNYRNYVTRTNNSDSALPMESRMRLDTLILVPQAFHRQ